MASWKLKGVALAAILAISAGVAGAADAATGKRLWRRSWKTGLLPDVHKTNSHILKASSFKLLLQNVKVREAKYGGRRRWFRHFRKCSA